MGDANLPNRAKPCEKCAGLRAKQAGNIWVLCEKCKLNSKLGDGAKDSGAKSRKRKKTPRPHRRRRTDSTARLTEAVRKLMSTRPAVGESRSKQSKRSAPSSKSADGSVHEKPLTSASDLLFLDPSEVPSDRTSTPETSVPPKSATDGPPSDGSGSEEESSSSNPVKP